MPSPRPQLDLVCLGRAGVDFYAEQTGSRLEDVASLAKYIGGSSTNIACCASRLGLSTGLVTRVGDEHMGRFIREQLAREGVDATGVVTDPERLTALVVLGIENRDTFPLIFYRENCADMAIAPEDLDADWIGSAKALLITGTHFSTKGVHRASSAALDIAAERGLRTALDIDYRPVLWGLTGRGDGETRFVASGRVTEHLQGILPRFDLVIGTEEEIHIAGGSTDTLDALRAVRAVTGAAIVLKRGPFGATVFEGAIPDALDDGITVEGVTVEVMNVLGAGDAFAAGFLSGWIAGEPHRMSLLRANASGALVVSRHGCTPAMPTREELDHYLAHRDAIPRPDVDPELRYLHRVTTRVGSWPALAALAFDHRSQLEAMARETGASAEHLPYLKSLLLRAADDVLGARGLHGRGGVLCDDVHGADVLDAATGRAEDRRLWIGRPIERPGSRPLSFEHGLDAGTQLRRWPLDHVVKCLALFSTADEGAMREAQETRLLELWGAALDSGHELLLEIIPPADDPLAVGESVCRSAERLYATGHPARLVEGAVHGPGVSGAAGGARRRARAALPRHRRAGARRADRCAGGGLRGLRGAGPREGLRGGPQHLRRARPGLARRGHRRRDARDARVRQLRRRHRRLRTGDGRGARRPDRFLRNAHEHDPADDGAGAGAPPRRAEGRGGRRRGAAVRGAVGDLRPRQRAGAGRGPARGTRAAADLARAERAGDGPRRGRLRQADAAPAHDGRDELGRTGRQQPAHGRGHRVREPPARAAAARRHLRGTAPPRPCCRRWSVPTTAPANVNDAFRPVSAWFDRLTRPEQLITSLPRAISVLTDPELAGPGDAVACRRTCRRKCFDWPEWFFDERVHRPSRIGADADALERAAAMLRNAKRPVIVAGGGVHYSDACDALAAFADAHDVPVVETSAGKGALPASHRMNAGAVGVVGTSCANAMVGSADCLLTVGTRLSDFTTGSRSVISNVRVPQVNLNVAQLDATRHGAVPLRSDARRALEELGPRLDGWRSEPAHLEALASARKDWNAIVTKALAGSGQNRPSDAQVTDVLNRHADHAKDVLVVAAGSMPSEGAKLWAPEHSRGYHSEYGYSCMGYEIAGGIGVKMAEGELGTGAEVFVVVGDGSYLMMNSEILTSVALGTKLVIVVLDNRGFGCINRLQGACGQEAFNNLLDDGTAAEVAYPKVDFAAHAAALGATSEHVDSLDGLRGALERARQASGTVCISIDTNAVDSTDGGSWWQVGIPAVSTRDEVVEARRDWQDANRDRQAF